MNWRTVRRVLCLGAHADDVEIGCGGTLLRLLSEHPGIEVRWLVLSGSGIRRKEARASARAFLEKARTRRIDTAAFRESYFPQQWGEIKNAFEAIRKRFEPDLIFTHCRADLHQDHRVLCELTWNTFRDHAILEYEIPKYEADLGQPNFYVALNEACCRRKVELLLHHFGTQSKRHWFAEDTFWALLRLRGIESGPGVRYAEAFHARKLVV